MPFCPNCKTEYRDGFTTCADCGARLVYRLEPEPPVQQPEEVYTEDEPALLFAASSKIECEMVEGCLKSAGIPFLSKEHSVSGPSRVYAGYSANGADFYVPSKLLPKAREVLGNFLPPEEREFSEFDPAMRQEEPEEETKNKSEQHNKTKKFVTRIILLAIVAVFLGSLIISLIQSFSSLHW